MKHSILYNTCIAYYNESTAIIYIYHQLKAYSGEVLSKLKCRGFRATSLSTYDFSSLYTTLPHNLMKEKLLDLIEWTFKRALKTMVYFIWHVMTERLFSLPLTKVGIHFGHVRMCATPCPISLIIFILNLGPSYTDKLLEFRWVQIAYLS